VAERFKAPVLKTGAPARAPWVRIPPHPPQTNSPSFVPNYKGVDVSLVVKVIELEVHREPDDEPVALWTSKPDRKPGVGSHRSHSGLGDNARLPAG
jgi:hypothetical protein